MNKTFVPPEGPNVAVSGKQSRVSKHQSGPRAGGPRGQPTCLVWPKASLRALYPSHKSLDRWWCRKERCRTTRTCIMWLTIKDTSGFQSNKTLVWPKGPNVAARGKQSQVSQDWSGPRPDGPAYVLGVAKGQLGCAVPKS